MHALISAQLLIKLGKKKTLAANWLLFCHTTGEGIGQIGFRHVYKILIHESVWWIPLIVFTWLYRNVSKYKRTEPFNNVDTSSGEPLYNEVFGLTNDFLYAVIVKYMTKNLDITKPR